MHKALGLCSMCYQKSKPRTDAQKEADRLRHKAWREDNREGLRERSVYNYESLRDSRFNLRPGQYQEMLEAQNFSCAICQIHVDNQSRALAVDHDHSCCAGNYSCGQCVRGLLCSRCNRSLGLAGDSIQTVRKMEAYLINHGGVE